jgi:hypothetical protein
MPARTRSGTIAPRAPNPNRQKFFGFFFKKELLPSGIAKYQAPRQ